MRLIRLRAEFGIFCRELCQDEKNPSGKSESTEPAKAAEVLTELPAAEVDEEKESMAKPVVVQKPAKKFFDAEWMMILHKPLWATKTRIPAILQHLQCLLEKADTPGNQTVTDAASPGPGAGAEDPKSTKLAERNIRARFKLSKIEGGRFSLKLNSEKKRGQ